MDDIIESYWDNHFQGYSPAAFPCLTGLRPEVALGQIRSVELRSSISLSELQAKAKSYDYSPLAAVQAAWGSILQAYHGSQDVAFGSVLVGCCKDAAHRHWTTQLSLLPVRLRRNIRQLDASCTNIELLRKLTEEHIEISKHPFAHNDSRSGEGKEYLFDTAVLLQTFSLNEHETGIEQAIDLFLTQNKLAVMIEISTDINTSTKLRARFIDEYLDGNSAILMLEQLNDVLSWILSHLAGVFEDASANVKPSLQSCLNPRPKIDSSQKSLVHSQFETHAKVCPSDLAIIFINDLKNEQSPLNIQWTYATLNDKANDLADYLDTNFGPLAGTPVPIYMEKSPYLYFTVLGIVKAGGAWCPIDTLSPATRRRELIARTQARIVLVAQEPSEIEPESLPEGVTVMDVRSVKPKSPLHGIPPPILLQGKLAQPHDMAYLIWTSGTTGPPKGVSISHEAAVTSMKALQSHIPSKTRYGGPIRCMQFSQHTFDVFVQDCFYTWGLGGVLISATRDIMIGAFPELANLTQATHAHLTPAFADGLPRASCKTLEIITMIGEKLPQHVADDWGRDILAYNTYGPAEVTVVSTIKQFGGGKNLMNSSNIGFPLPSVSCYVLKNDRLTMVNGVGELALGGYQLAKGYWKDTQKTSQRFRRNEVIGEDLYMTGDIVRQLANGSLEFIGREDDLVKLGGIRVELSEISYALRKYLPSIDQIETFYVGRSDRPTKVIVSFVTARGLEITSSDQSLLLISDYSAEIAKAALETGRSSLPGYMAPNVVVVVKHIPRTPSAKVDRKALLDAYESLDLSVWELKINLYSTAGVAQTPFTEAEIAVLDAVSSLSGVEIENINRSTYLTALGIDSLLSGRLLSKVRNFGCKAGLEDVLHCRTVEDLMQLTMGTRNGIIGYEDATFDVLKFHDQWSQLVLKSLGRGDLFILPASTLQEGLLSESMANHKSYWSNHFFNLQLDTNLDQLCAAWATVQIQNQALRTGFYPVAAIDQLTESLKCNHNFLQLIYDEIDTDYRYVSTPEQDCKEAALACAIDVTLRHHQASFINPPWAVNIISHRDGLMMMLSIHHAIYDDPSFGFIVRDVWDAYKGLGKAMNPRCQLRDAMSIMLASDTNDYRGSKVWLDRLRQFTDSDATSWPDLTGRREPSKEGAERAFVSVTYKLQMFKKGIRSVLQTLAVTPISIIRAAFGCLLLDYLETEVVVFGEAISERVFYPDLADAIAPMLSVVPVPLRRQDTALEILRELEKVTSLARSYRHIPATLIKDLLKRSRHQSLYPAIFSFNPAELQYELDGDTDTSEKLEDLIGLSVEHPLALNVTNDDGWTLELFAENTFMIQEHLQVFASQIDALAQAMIRSPQAPLASLLDAYPGKVKSMTESHLPETTDHLSTLYPSRWVEHHAKLHPEWNAVEIAGKISVHGAITQSWTYSQLEEESNRIATYIYIAGHQNQIVAMCCGRTLVSFAVILGILKSGNTYLPVDESLPSERKLLLLKDSRCVMLFTDSHCLKLFETIPDACSTVNLDDTQTTQTMSSLSTERRSNRIDPNNSAYLLYTSGSTGKPKGVLVSYKNLCGFVEGLSAFMGQCMPATHMKGGIGKWLGLASRAFDVHLCEIFLGWRLGLTVSTAAREVLLDNLELALKALKITHACFVPSLLDQAGIEPDHVPDLVYFSVGGEKVSKQVLDTWANQDNTLIINAYGPTEMTIGCSASMITSRSNARNIGRPFGNTGAHVLLPGTYNYAKRGQSGELCFTGDLVGNGYFERPDVVGFVSNFHGQRMYRTGDVVRMIADGSLEYLGRSDDQTKIRGQRIELGEVSESIRTSSVESVDVATLIIRHPELANNLLVSFVSYSTERSRRYGVQPSLVQKYSHTFGQQVQAECRKRLPAYMVPDHVILIDVVPLAQVSGKADAKTLRAFFSSIPLSSLLGSSKSSDQTMEEPRSLTGAERKVLDSVQSIIDIQTSLIRYDSNIFQLGIDSLKAVGLSIELRKSGFAASVISVLNHPTIQDLASLPMADATMDSGTIDSTEPQRNLSNIELDVYKKATFKLSENLIQSIRPCLPLQEGIVARSHGSDSGDLYIQHLVIELDNSVDLSLFRQAWSDVAEGTAILRTCFIPVEDNIFQIILKPSAVPLPWIESSGEDGHRTLELLRAEQKTVAQSLIEFMETTPPIRLHLAVSKPHRSILSISIHHALYDGISFDMILNEVYLRYYGKPPKTRASFDVLLGHVACQDRSEQELFWTKRLSGHSRTIIGTNLTQEMQENTIERTMRVAFSDLRTLSASLKATIPTLLQTLYGALLARMVGQSDVLFGAILSGRTGTVDGAETILAPCITTVPQRLRFRSGFIKLSAVITELQKSNIELLQFQHTSLRQINRWVGAVKPLFDSLFSYIQGTEPPRYKGLWQEIESSMSPDYPFAIEFEPNEEADRLIARLTFTPLFGPQEKAHTILEEMDLLLTALNNGEDVTVDSLQIQDNKGVLEENKDTVWDEVSWTPEEAMMKKVTTMFCKVDSSLVTKNISFFRLGIDSITAIQFARSLREAQIEVKSSDVLRYPCIGTLWYHIFLKQKAIIENNIGSKNLNEGMLVRESKILASHYGDIETTYACTPLQTGMITATLTSAGCLYVHHHAVRLRPKVDIVNLKKAWNILVQSNDIFRTTFHAIAEGQNPWIACVHESRKVRWFELTSEISTDNFIEDISKSMIYQNEMDFKEPPVQVHILHTTAENFLVISMHHALYDGLSIPMVFDELAHVYNNDVPRRRLSYHSAARWLHSDEAKSVGFWTENLRDYLPLWNPHILSGKPQVMIYAEKTATTVMTYVKDACKLLGVTIQTLLLLACGKVLSCHHGRRDVVFGHVIAGRSFPLDGIEDVIGPLFNTVPFRIRLNQPLQSNEMMAAGIQQFGSSSLPFQHASLQLVQNAWRRQNHKPNASLFDTLFLFQNDTNASGSINDLWEPFVCSGEFSRSEYQLNFEITETLECLKIRASCYEEYMSMDNLLALVNLFDATFLDLIDHPSRSVLAFPENLSTTPIVVEHLPDSKQPEHSLSHLDDRNPSVKVLCRIMSEVSEISMDDITPETSIYAIGLDSIKAIRLASKCRERGLHLSVADIIQGVTPVQICSLISKTASHHGTHGTELDPCTEYKGLDLQGIDRRNVEIILPCLSGQTYHLINWLNSGRTILEPTWAYQTGKLNSKRLEEAWAQLQIRHQILRTTYIATSVHEAAQVILKPSTVTSTNLITIQAMADFDEAVERQIRFEAKNPSDLSIAPVGLCLIQGKDRDAVLLTLHHASYDAWTIPFLISDLAALYAGLNLDPTPDFSAFVKHTICSRRSLDHKSFWQNILRAAQPTLLNPPSSPIPHTTIPKFQPQKFLLLPSLIPNLSSLTILSRTHNTTLQVLLLLAFARLLARLTDTTNPTFGIYQLARSATFKDIHQLTGPCLNITPFSVHNPLDSSTTASAKNIQTDLARRVPYEQSYLSEILSCVNKGVLFNTYINILFPPPGSDSPSNSSFPSPSKVTHPPLPPLSTLTPLPLGSPIDFAPTYPIPGETAVDGLQWPLLARGGLFLDVAIRQQQDEGGEGHLDVGARGEGEGWDREMLERVVRGFAEEVEGLELE